MPRDKSAELRNGNQPCTESEVGGDDSLCKRIPGCEVEYHSERRSSR